MRAPLHAVEPYAFGVVMQMHQTWRVWTKSFKKWMEYLILLALPRSNPQHDNCITLMNSFVYRAILPEEYPDAVVLFVGYFDDPHSRILSSPHPNLLRSTFHSYESDLNWPWPVRSSSFRFLCVCRFENGRCTSGTSNRQSD